jgi:hypothetical protein
MLLVGSNGTRFELAILAYEFPDIEDDVWESNWVWVRIDVVNHQGTWTSKLTMQNAELEVLSEWLVGNGSHADELELQFLEPTLSFSIQDESAAGCTLRIWFELEARARWAPWEIVPQRDLWTDLRITREDALRASEELRGELAPFPFRGRAD